MLIAYDRTRNHPPALCLLGAIVPYCPQEVPTKALGVSVKLVMKLQSWSLCMCVPIWLSGYNITGMW